MLILSNLLALALVVADEPRPAEPPPASSSMPKIHKPHTSGDPVADEAWHLSLPDAIKIGLDNSEAIRVIRLRFGGVGVGDEEGPTTPDNVSARFANTWLKGSEVAIAPLDRDASTWKFRAEVMAHVRSIEQTYWALSHQHVTLWSRETALRLGEEILKRERAELEAGRSNPGNVAEVEQQVENYKLNLVSATSDVITTERQLRNILGLPPEDGRRIVPSTAPTEARLEPDWEVSVREMTGSQPDIAQQAVVVRLAELQLLLARNQLLPLLGPEALHEFGNLGGRLDEVAPGGLAEFIRRDAARPSPAGMDPSDAREPEFIAGQVGLGPTAGIAPAPRPSPANPEASRWESGGPFAVPTGIHPALANTRQCQYRLLNERALQRQILHQSTHSLARFFLEVDANYNQFRTAQRLRAASRNRLEAQRALHEQGRITVDRLLDAVGQHANAIEQESLYKSTYNTSIAALEEAKGTLLAYDHIAVIEGPSPRKAYVQARDRGVAPASFESEGPAAPGPAGQAAPIPMTYKIKARLWGVKFLEVEVEASPAPTPPAAPPGR